ncbi:MAG: nucleotidyltransferase, partial [Winogradskyella arenosi]
HNNAVKSYQAVGSWLSKEDSLLAKYNPQILTQGSFLLGTVIKPVNENDDLDIDLVCELTGKNESWTQKDLKKIVGDRLKQNDTYKEMLDEEGRRCWTLEYRKESENENEKYHMDILPSIISDGYSVLLTKAFSENRFEEVNKLAIRITDKESLNYSYDSDTENWLKSNPFGYGRWFFNRAAISTKKLFSLNESIKPAPKYQTEKLPLQRAVQILKRHRDIMFQGDVDKPISIIITTLSGRSYNGEENIVDAIKNIISNMHLHIEEKFNASLNKKIKYITNPVNEEENFADKWVEHPKRETNFYKWLDQVMLDFDSILSKTQGLQFINESMQKPFGESLTTKTFSSYGTNKLEQRENGGLKVAAVTGT